MTLLSNLVSNEEIIEVLELRRDNLCDELLVIGFSLDNDKEMPIAVRELRTIRANTLEYEIEELRKRIAMLSS